MKWIAIFALMISLSVSAQSSQQEQDAAALGALILSTKILADSDLRCRIPSDCAVVEVGARPCGGPATHFITSFFNSNLLELQYLSYQTHVKGEAFNRNYGRISICTVVVPPIPKCIEQRCQK